MKTYKSHKTVQAAKIVGFERQSEGDTPYGATLRLDNGDGSSSFVNVTAGWLNKHGGQDHDGPDADRDMVGGYLVEYEDGYLSWSPPEAFEGGYRELGAEATGLPVAGYKPTQPQWAIDAVNQFKALEERTLRAAEGLEGAAVDQRLLAIGKTQLQGAFMFLARAIFQPGRVTLPEDSQGNLDLGAAPGGPAGYDSFGG